MQEVITKLNTEGGMLRIDEIYTNVSWCRDQIVATILERQLLPLLFMLTDSKIGSSFVLERLLGQTYHFLYGAASLQVFPENKCFR